MLFIVVRIYLKIDMICSKMMCKRDLAQQLSSNLSFDIRVIIIIIIIIIIITIIIINNNTNSSNIIITMTIIRKHV